MVGWGIFLPGMWVLLKYYENMCMLFCFNRIYVYVCIVALTIKQINVMTTLKSYPQKNASVRAILKGINEGTFYTASTERLREHGFESMTVGISAAEFSVEKADRYQIQTVRIPKGKKGNLSKFAGNKVQVITTTIDSRSPRINFFIKIK